MIGPTEVKALALALLDDDCGVNDKVFGLLEKMIDECGLQDIKNHIECEEGGDGDRRYFIAEDEMENVK